MSNVHKLQMEDYRSKVRLEFPNYDGPEWSINKEAWGSSDTYSIPTGMFKDDPNCKEKDVTFYSSIYKNLGAVMPKKKNPE